MMFLRFFIWEFGTPYKFLANIEGPTEMGLRSACLRINRIAAMVSSCRMTRTKARPDRTGVLHLLGASLSDFLAAHFNDFSFGCFSISSATCRSFVTSSSPNVENPRKTSRSYPWDNHRSPRNPGGRRVSVWKNLWQLPAFMAGMPSAGDAVQDLGQHLPYTFGIAQSTHSRIFLPHTLPG